MSLETCINTACGLHYNLLYTNDSGWPEGLQIIVCPYCTFEQRREMTTRKYRSRPVTSPRRNGQGLTD